MVPRDLRLAGGAVLRIRSTRAASMTLVAAASLLAGVAATARADTISGTYELSGSTLLTTPISVGSTSYAELVAFSLQTDGFVSGDLPGSERLLIDSSTTTVLGGVPYAVAGSFTLSAGRGVEVTGQLLTVAPLDVTGDGSVSAADALAVINTLNNPNAQPPEAYDVNQDGQVTSLDALLITNWLSLGVSAGVFEGSFQDGVQVGGTELTLLVSFGGAAPSMLVGITNALVDADGSLLIAAANPGTTATATFLSLDRSITYAQNAQLMTLPFRADAVVPEPASLGFAALGALAAIARRRRGSARA